MVAFYTSTFEPETDEDRPSVGDKLTREDGKQYEVMEVGYITATQLMSRILDKNYKPDLRGHDEAFTRPHSTRPGIIWEVRVKEITS